MHSGTWWVGDDDIGLTVLCDKLVSKDILHIASIEQGVVYAVNLRVDLSVLDSLGHILDTYHPASLASHKVGNGTCTCIEVVNHLVASKPSKVASYRVQVVSLLGIGLIEALGTNLKLQVFHEFVDMIIALEHHDILIAYGVVALLIVEIHQRCNLWELVSYMLQQILGLSLALSQCLA